MPDSFDTAGSPLASNAGAVDFNIYTAGMEAEPLFGTAQRPIVRMVGSSTEQDLHRDTMTVTALNDMTKAPMGMLIWLNHDYSVPDSVFGSLCEQPIIIQKGGVADLHIACDVELDNPAAAKTYKLIQNRRRLGCSIGCSVEDYQLVDSGLPKGTPGWDVPLVHITHVKTVEWSVVGVPANQRSWIENAVHGLWVKMLGDKSRYEEALRLAPVVKGLFPKSYNRILNNPALDNEFASALKSVTPRPTPAHRLLWTPDTKKFTFFPENSDNGVEVAPEQAAPLLDGIREKFFEYKSIDTSLLTASADDAAKKAQEARSKKYHIGVKEGGNVTKPGEWSSVPDEAYGDPVNYRYPMPDKTHADNAASRWGDASNRSQYSSEEQAIIGKRIEARQRHFGESQSDKKDKSVDVNILKSEVCEDGTILEYLASGQQTATSHTTNEDGTIDTWALKVQDDGTHEPMKGKHTHQHPDGDGSMHNHSHSHDGDSNHTAHDHGDGDLDGDGDGPNDSDNDGDNKKGVEGADLVTKSVDEPAEPAAPEASAAEPVAEPAEPVVEPATEEAPAAEEPAAPAPEEQKSVVDVQKKALLDLYNQLGTTLGLPEMSLDQKAALAADATAVRSLAKVIDDAADQLLKELGLPDDDSATEGGPVEKSADGVTTKAGASISAANKKRLQGAHDVLAEMAGGLHCADFISRHTDAPAKMQEQEDKEKSGEAEQLAALVEAAVAKHLGPLVERLDAMTSAIGGMATKALETDIVAARAEFALTRKALEDAKLDAAAVSENIRALMETGTGRPTKTFAGRQVPADGKLAGIASGLTDANGQSLEPAPEVASLEEALAVTTIEYVPGVGKCRHWTKGLGTSYRPSLSGEQMQGMTIQDITSYYAGGDARVPLMIDGQGNIIG